MDTQPSPAPLTPLGARTPHTHPGMYPLIIVLSVIIIAGVLWVFWPRSAHAPEPSPSVSALPASPSASPLSDDIRFPMDFTVEFKDPWFTDPTEPMPDPFLVTLVYHDAGTEGTNFSLGTLSIAKSGSEDPSLCLKDIPSGNPLTEMHTTPAGTWYIHRDTEGAAGSKYSTVAYNLLHNDSCYTLQVTVRTTNRDNFPDPNSMREFDPAAVFTSSESVLDSFRFLP